MTNAQIYAALELELQRSKKNHWPDHVVAQAAIVSKSAGVIISAATTYKYHRSSDKDEAARQMEDIRREAVETMAAAFKFLQQLKD